MAERRAAVVAAVREVAPVPIVNGGGTGSVHTHAPRGRRSPRSPPGRASSPPPCSTATPTSALTPAAMFAMPVVRRPSGGVATLLGGGYHASGAAGRGPPAGALPAARAAPRPAGGRRRGADAGDRVRRPLACAIGDRVYLRHAKAGELCERFDALYLVQRRRDRRRGADVPRRGSDRIVMAAGAHAPGPPLMSGRPVCPRCWCVGSASAGAGPDAGAGPAAAERRRGDDRRPDARVDARACATCARAGGARARRSIDAFVIDRALLPVARDASHRPVLAQPRRARQPPARRRLRPARHAREAAGVAPARRLPHRAHRQVPQRLRPGLAPTEVPPGWSEWYDVGRPLDLPVLRATGSTRTARRQHLRQRYSDRRVRATRAVDGDRAAARRPTPRSSCRSRSWRRTAAARASPTTRRRCDAGARRRATATLFAAEPLPRGRRRSTRPTSRTSRASSAGRPRLGSARDRRRSRRTTARSSESLLAVDEARRARSSTRCAAPASSSDTLIVFTSDNGFFHGEHRVPERQGDALRALDPRAARAAPGPGCRRAARRRQLVTNADLAPTILDAAGATPGRTPGRPLAVPAAGGPRAWSGAATCWSRGRRGASPWPSPRCARTATCTPSTRTATGAVRPPARPAPAAQPATATLALRGRAGAAGGAAGARCRCAPGPPVAPAARAPEPACVPAARDRDGRLERVRIACGCPGSCAPACARATGVW